MDSITSSSFHPLTHSYVLWAHLPHDTNWNIASYQRIHVDPVSTVEEAVAITETVSDTLVKNCMLFLMKSGVAPIWEDVENRRGGSFSYKVANKQVYDVWRALSYALMGDTISTNLTFVAKVTGITISPKKNFCIIKLWMSTCEFQNASLVTAKIDGISAAGCLFKKHSPEY